MHTHRAFKILLLHVFNRADLNDSGIVEKNIDVAIASQNLCHGSLHAVFTDFVSLAVVVGKKVGGSRGLGLILARQISSEGGKLLLWFLYGGIRGISAAYQKKKRCADNKCACCASRSGARGPRDCGHPVVQRAFRFAREASRDGPKQVFSAL